MNQIDYSFSLLQNLGNIYTNSGFEEKQGLIGSIFAENLIFSKNKYRNPHLNSVFTLFASNKKDFERSEKRKPEKISGLSSWAPPLGLEPRAL